MIFTAIDAPVGYGSVYVSGDYRLVLQVAAFGDYACVLMYCGAHVLTAVGPGALSRAIEACRNHAGIEAAP